MAVSKYYLTDSIIDYIHVFVGFGDRVPGWFGFTSNEADRTHQAWCRGNDECNRAPQWN